MPRMELRPWYKTDDQRWISFSENRHRFRKLGGDSFIVLLTTMDTILKMRDDRVWLEGFIS